MDHVSAESMQGSVPHIVSMPGAVRYGSGLTLACAASDRVLTRTLLSRSAALIIPGTWELGISQGISHYGYINELFGSSSTASGLACLKVECCVPHLGSLLKHVASKAPAQPSLCRAQRTMLCLPTLPAATSITPVPPR